MRSNRVEAAAALFFAAVFVAVVAVAVAFTVNAIIAAAL